MATILNNLSKKGLQKRTKKVIVCSYCFFVIPKKHLIKCSDCGRVFCKSCLTEIGKEMVCNDCLVYFVRNKVRLVITK